MKIAFEIKKSLSNTKRVKILSLKNCRMTPDCTSTLIESSIFVGAAVMQS